MNRAGWSVRRVERADAFPSGISDRSLGYGTIKVAVGSGQVLGWPLFLGQLRSLMVTRPDSCAGGVRSRSAPSRPPTSASSKTSCSPELYQATQTG